MLNQQSRKFAFNIVQTCQEHDHKATETASRCKTSRQGRKSAAEARDRILAQQLDD